MNANEITFGVEIETTVPAGTVQVGPHGYGLPIPQLPGWKADADPSIRTTPGTRGHVACEFVSPVYKGAEGLKQLLADLAVIKGFGAAVNSSCGLHVHVGFDKADAAAVEKLVTLVSNFEKAIYASTGTKSRETGRWCNGVNRYGSAERAVQNAAFSRYHVLNLSTGGKPTVEFRAFAATLNADKITGHVLMCVGLVERALKAKKATDWTAKQPKESSPIHRNGEGQTALTRLFYQLGWTKGRQPHAHGDLTSEGTPDLPRVKKELMRLAKKYDAPPPVVAPAAPSAAAPSTSSLPFPVGTRVRGVSGRIEGWEGTVIQRIRRRQPIVRFDNGRTYRVRMACLVAI